MIRSISEWARREHGASKNFCLTQLIMGHEYFRKYRYNFNREPIPFYKSCGQDKNTAEHIFLYTLGGTTAASRLKRISVLQLRKTSSEKCFKMTLGGARSRPLSRRYCASKGRRATQMIRPRLCEIYRYCGGYVINRNK